MNTYIIQTNMKANNFTLIVQGMNESDAREKAIAMWMNHIGIVEDTNHMANTQPRFLHVNSEMYYLASSKKGNCFADEMIDEANEDEESLVEARSYALARITKWISMAKVSRLTPSTLVFSSFSD